MTFRRILGVVAAIALLAAHSNAFAQAEAGVPSLTIPPGARANGMGEAFVAVSDDATAGWWNAGGLAFIKTRNLAFMHSSLVPDLVNDVYYEYLGYASPAGDVGVWSASVIFLNYGKSQATDDQGNDRGTFTSWEGSLNASFAMQFGDRLGLGASMKFIRVDYAPANVTIENVQGAGTSFAVDLGALYKFEKPKINLGLAVTNMGPNIAFIDREQSDPLPITARFGAAYTAVADDISNLLVTADVEQSLVWLVDSNVTQRRSEVWHAGVEYRYVNLLAGRVGYVYDKDGNFKDATYGLGFIYKDKLSLDYANVPQAQSLERVHRWSLYFTF
jgi:Type IX secretion system protein PorV